MQTDNIQPSKHFEDLVALMARLRAECPWDKKQTNTSLIPFAIEETYELVDAIQNGDNEDVKSELGDVLLQVVFHACLYAEKQAENGQSGFDIGDVIYTLMEKLIRRHPHVFDKAHLTDEDAVAKRWDEIKAEERAADTARGKVRGRLDEVKAGSALTQSQALQKAASKLGFDWDEVAGARAKLTEELAELDEVISTGDKAAIQDELGDCFFALVNVARKLKVDSETATLGSVHKFRQRFGYIEDELAKRGKTPEESSLEEMDVLWEQAKVALGS